MSGERRLGRSPLGGRGRVAKPGIAADETKCRPLRCKRPVAARRPRRPQRTGKRGDWSKSHAPPLVCGDTVACVTQNRAVPSPRAEVPARHPLVLRPHLSSRGRPPPTTAATSPLRSSKGCTSSACSTPRGARSGRRRATRHPTQHALPEAQGLRHRPVGLPRLSRPARWLRLVAESPVTSLGVGPHIVRRGAP